MIEDIKLEKFAEEPCIADIGLTQLKNEIKKLPLEEKMAKEVEMKKMQQEVTMLCTQYQERNDRVVELLAEVEWIIGII